MEDTDYMSRAKVLLAEEVMTEFNITKRAFQLFMDENYLIRIGDLLYNGHDYDKRLARVFKLLSVWCNILGLVLLPIGLLLVSLTHSRWALFMALSSLVFLLGTFFFTSTTNYFAIKRKGYKMTLDEAMKKVRPN